VIGGIVHGVSQHQPAGSRCVIRSASPLTR